MAKYQPLPYYFHADGHAFSAHFHRPVEVPIPAQASVSLPNIGGIAHAGADNFEIPRIASFRSAQTHVSGSWPSDDTVTTSATSVVEDLSVLDFLRVDRVVARVTAEYKLDKNNNESHIIALGSHFENLTLGGHLVKITLRHDLLIKSKTFLDLAKNVAGDGKSGRIAVHGKRSLVCSLVEKIETDLVDVPGVEIEGHVIRIPHFGEIAFAEIFAEHGRRTLTMLRFHLGSPDGGKGTGGQVSTNGQPPGGN
jgi:hypothetical protein